DSFGELTSGIDGRGVSIPDSFHDPNNPNTDPAPVVSANGSAASYTHTMAYNTQGDQTSSSTPSITTTLHGVTTTGVVTSSSTPDGDGEVTASTSANGDVSTASYDHLGRVIG